MEGCVVYEHTQAQEPVYQEIDQIATQEEMYDVYNYGRRLVGIVKCNLMVVGLMD